MPSTSQATSAPAGAAAHIAGFDRRSRLLRAAAAYLGTALLSVAILYPVLHLWQADLSVPLYTSHDVYFHTAVVKNLVETSNWFTVPALGAPGRLEFYDYPLPNLAHLTTIKFLALFSHNFALVFNLFFLASFPLAAISALLVLRQLQLSYASAVPAAVLFAFLPFHFGHGAAGHLFITAYYFVPLILLVALWVLAGEPLFCFDRGLRFLTGKGAASLAICVLIAADGPYFAFFGGFFVLVAGLLVVFRYRRRSQAAAMAAILGTLVVSFALVLLPSLVHFYRYGRDHIAATRSPAEAEKFGLKMAQLVLPVSGHRVPFLRDLKAAYGSGGSAGRWNEGDDAASLGFIGSAGFILLLGWIFFGGGRGRTAELLDGLSLLNLAGLLLGTIGGLGAIFALLVTAQFRAYNRISVFLAFFCLAAIAVLLEELRGRLSGSVGYVLAALLLAIGILDQTSPGFVPQYRQIQAEYASDDAFVKRIESSIPAHAMIFQLPYVSFPEGPFTNRMFVYDHQRAYLHSASLRWSGGALKYGPGDAWYQKTADRHPADLVADLRSAGFSGIYVDRFGYRDNGAAVEAELSRVLGEPPLISDNSRLVFFKINR